MASVNKAIILGHLGRDPESRYSSDGNAICNVSIATSEQWKDKSTGEKQERVEWHRVVFFNRLAEIAGEYLKKGAQVYVEGAIRTRKWTDKEGQERYTTEIVAERLQMLGSKSGDRAESEERPEQPKREPAKSAARGKPSGGAGTFNDLEDDIPF